MESINIIGPLSFKAEIDPQRPSYFVDGGVRHLNESFVDAILLGDGDSALPHTLFHKRYPSEKDQSDLALTLLEVKNRHPDCELRLLLYGFLGGRLDHQLAVLGECLKFVNTDLHLELIGDDQHILMRPAGRFNFSHHGVLSFFTLVPSRFKCDGALKYKALEYTHINSLSSLTLSNEASGNFTLECLDPFMVILNLF